MGGRRASHPVPSPPSSLPVGLKCEATSGASLYNECANALPSKALDAASFARGLSFVPHHAEANCKQKSSLSHNNATISLREPPWPGGVGCTHHPTQEVSRFLLLPSNSSHSNAVRSVR